MDGRRRFRGVAGLLLVAAATGCNRNATLPNGQNPPLPAADTSKASAEMSKLLGSKAGPVVGAPQVAAAETPKHKRGDPLKPETETALADTEVEAAFTGDRAAVERDQLLDSARQRYQRALKAQPKYQPAALGLARLYAKSGNAERSVETYRAALKVSPKDHGLAHQMAAAQARFGNWAGAAESCRYALSLDPENRTYQKTLGFNLAQLDQWDEAHAALARVMPEAEARYFLGRILFDQDKPAEARAQMDLALQADPQYVLAQQFVADLNAVPTAGAGGVQTVGHTEAATDAGK